MEKLTRKLLAGIRIAGNDVWSNIGLASLFSFLSLWSLEICANEYAVQFDNPGTVQILDRWMYPFNVTPGSRVNAPTFGAVGSEGFDERDGQFLLAIDTVSLGIEANLPVGDYLIESVTVEVTESVGGYRFDDSYDTFQTYLPSDNELFLPDEDPGRPIELFGAGMRNGFESFLWADGGATSVAPWFSAGSSFGPRDKGARNVYAVDAVGNDVSNNVDALNGGANGFDSAPFATARAYVDGEQLTAGATVPNGASLLFDVDLSDSNVLSYFQSSLSRGQLGLVITSLHNAGLMGEDEPFPNLATADHFSAAAPVFRIDVEVRSNQLEGDFDGDGILTVNDIDRLTQEVLNQSHRSEFDITGDGFVDSADRTRWVVELFATHFGDANLDGQFGTADLIVVFQAGQYEDHLKMNSTWSTGDWNGDAEFNSADLVLVFQNGAFEKGAAETPQAVAEPTGGVLMYAIVLLSIWRLPWQTD